MTSPYHGSTISGWQQNQRRRQRQGDRQKNDMFILTNNNFASTSRYFVHFFTVVAPLRHETSLFHEPALWSRWMQHKNCPFHFLNLDNVTYGSKENFAKIWQIKWNWIRSVRCFERRNRKSAHVYSRGRSGCNGRSPRVLTLPQCKRKHKGFGRKFPTKVRNLCNVQD